jgi:hypothetical protein
MTDGLVGGITSEKILRIDRSVVDQPLGQSVNRPAVDLPAAGRPAVGRDHEKRDE